MKNFAKFFVSVAVLFVGVSCATDSTEDLGQQVVGKGQTVLTVSTGESVIDTKTSLGDKNGETYPIYWSEGDQLSLNGVASSKLEGVEAQQKSATFTWDGTFDAPFCVAYPASAEGTVTFATSQKYVEGTFAPKAMPMYGYNDVVGAESVELHYLAGVLRIGLYADEETTIKSMYVENLEGTPIAGAFNCNFANGGAVTPAEGAVSTISYDAEGVVLSQSEAAPTLFHITVPEGYYDVLRLTIITDKGTMIAKVRAGQESAGGKIEAGVVREFATKKFNTNGGNYFEVKSQADLETLKAHIAENTLKDYDIVRVTADFAVEGWTAPIDGFDGMLDGNNHTISGLTAPLFGELKGAVSNLNLAAAISVSNEENVGIVARSMSADAILRNCNTSGTLKFNGSTEVVKLGGLVGTTELGAQISECTNNAAITLTGECSGYFGGIAGKAQAYIWDSENKGAITFDANATTSQQLYVGGIAGENNDLYISACTNDAAITLNGTVNDSTTGKEFYVGGLLGRYGRDVGSASVAPRDSENTANGDITIGGTITLRECTPAAGKSGAQATTTNYQNWGGLCGRANQNGPARCINRGDLVVNATFTNEKSYVSSKSTNDSHLYISPWIGGIYGHGTVAVDADTANYGSVVWESDCKFNVVLGGMVGRASTITNSTTKNYGTVKFDAETTGNVYLGGFCGISMQAHKNIENYGTIEFAENAKAATLYIAGLAGSGNLLFYEGTTARSTHYGITGGKNYGKVTLNGDTTAGAFVAGVCGYVGNAVFDGCQNLVDSTIEGSGSINVSATASITGKLYISGICGQSNSTAGGCKIQNCQNDGALYFYGTSTSSSYIGGIAGFTLKPSGVSTCTNNGAIYMDGSNGAAGYIGGIIGYTANGGTLTDLHNRGDITVAGLNKNVNASGIGAISGTNEITNSSSICNLKSISPDLNLGMFNGYAATTSRKVTNSKVGGTIQRAGDEAPITITEENYKNYLFSGNTSYPAVQGTNYDNITVVTPSTEE